MTGVPASAAPIPVPKGGFLTNEDEARWLEQTISMRLREGLAALGINVAPQFGQLYDLFLLSLNYASKRALRQDPRHALIERLLNLKALYVLEGGASEIALEMMKALSDFEDSKSRLRRAWLAEQSAKILWCVHVIGPDDLHAAPDFEAAVRMAAELSGALAPHLSTDISCLPVVAVWPWSAKAHAESLAKAKKP